MTLKEASIGMNQVNLPLLLSSKQSSCLSEVIFVAKYLTELFPRLKYNFEKIRITKINQSII